MTNFDAMIRALAEAKQHVSDLNDTHSGVLVEIATAKNLAKTIEDNVRIQAKSYFEETGDRNPHSAISIQSTTVRNYDTPHNVSLAMERAPAVLVVNKERAEDNLHSLVVKIQEFKDGIDEGHVSTAAEVASEIVGMITNMLGIDDRAMRDLIKAGGGKWAVPQEAKVNSVRLQSRLGEFLIFEDDERQSDSGG